MYDRSPRDDNGFTMIEILVVIIIIGILAAIAVPIYLNQRRAANDAALTQDVRNMAMAFQTFYVEADPGERHDKPGSASWTVVEYGDNDVIFIGYRNGRPAEFPNGVRPDGMPKVPVSSGVAIGVTDTPGSGPRKREAGEFCILGNATNSSYEAERGGSFFEGLKSTLYYDSSAGGITQPEDLTLDGACGMYAAWMEDA